MDKKLRIIFMGTPEFAVPGLQALVENNYIIVAVVTAPDKPAGRGLQVQASPVKSYAIKNNIPLFQPEKLRDPYFLEQLKSFKADLQIVVAFRMLPEIVWSMPPLGTVNLHASLLPDYRGAAPINWAIIQGEKETGVTTFFLKHAIDTGDIIYQEKIAIEENDTAGTLHDKLMFLGAGLILKTVDGIEKNNYPKIPQTTKSDKVAPKIFREQSFIDWNRDVSFIKNFIRGLSPHPAARTILEENHIKIFKAHVQEISHHERFGDHFTDHQSYLKFASKNGFVYIDELQMEGRKRMPVVEFLKGYRK